MTLHQLLTQYGMHRPIDLARRAGMSRQYAQLLWSGRLELSPKMARKIATATGIAYAALITAERATPPPTPRGRPRKPSEA